MSKNISIRFAQPSDTETILQFIRGLAEYENLPNEVVATSELLQEWIFEKRKTRRFCPVLP